MSKREHYTISFTCPTCHNKGEVEIAENANPVYNRGNLNQTIISISNGFKKEGMVVICNKCQISVPY
jgi:RecJ-like exonuclease